MKTEHKKLDYSDYGILGEKSVKKISPMLKKINLGPKVDRSNINQ